MKFARRESPCRTRHETFLLDRHEELKAYIERTDRAHGKK